MTRRPSARGHRITAQELLCTKDSRRHKYAILAADASCLTALLVAYIEAYGRIGRIEEGLRSVDEAFDDIRKTEERWWEAELHRTRGDLLHLLAMDAQADECLRVAIDVARQQRAKALELRASVSLARVWQRQRNRRKAHRLLAAAYGCFTEGLETPDLRDARSLLEQLAPRATRPLRRPTA